MTAHSPPPQKKKILVLKAFFWKSFKSLVYILQVCLYVKKLNFSKWSLLSFEKRQPLHSVHGEKKKKKRPLLYSCCILIAMQKNRYFHPGLLRINTFLRFQKGFHHLFPKFYSCTSWFCPQHALESSKSSQETQFFSPLQALR